jgi:hypothetical protein
MYRARRFLCPAPLLLVIGLVSVQAGAAEPSAAEVAIARRLFTEAAELEQAGRWTEAATKLREAIAIKDTPGLRYHLAHAEEQQGQLVEALVDYDRAAELLARGAKAPDVAARIGPAQTRLRERIPTLTVRVPEDVEQPLLTIDGQRIAPALMGQPIPLNPGPHRIEVTAPSREPFAVEVPLGEAERRELEAPLRLESTMAQAPGPAGSGSSAAGASLSADTGATNSGTLRSVVLIGELAVTAVGLGVGIGFTISAGAADDRIQRAQADVDRLDNSTGPCLDRNSPAQPACADLDEAVADKDRAQTLAVVGFAAAGVGAVSAVLTYVLWRPTSKSTEAAGTLRPAGGVARGGADRVSAAWLGVSGKF